MKTFKTHIKESSLSRLWKHNEEHDCGAMTAFRKAADCGEGEPYSNADNAKRNKSLLAKIKSKGYGATTLKGRYPEGGVVKKEISYFIVDLEDSGNLEKDMKKWGEEFEQDSVLIIPKGAIQNTTKAYLFGTNHCKDNWLGYGKKKVFAKGEMGYDSPIYTSYVNGRPFIFQEACDEILNPGNGMGWWTLHLEADKHWSKIEITNGEEE
jgi:hypothetical protein